MRRHRARRQRAERRHQQQEGADHERHRLPPGEEQHAETDRGRPGEQQRHGAQELRRGRQRRAERAVELRAEAHDRALEVARVGREQSERAEQQNVQDQHEAAIFAADAGQLSREAGSAEKPGRALSVAAAAD